MCFFQSIREGKEGVPFILNITVVSASSCEPIFNASVDLWHCDALGMYSHYTGAGIGGLSNASPAKDNTTFLRGIQFTDSNGLATFESIFPGYYVSRDTHIHVKVHIGGSVVHTGQLFVNDTLSDTINTFSPYNQNPGTRTRLSQDSVYTSTENASYGMLNVQLVDATAGYSGGMVGTIILGVNVASSSGSSGSDGSSGGSDDSGSSGSDDGNAGTTLQSPLGQLASWWFH